MKGIMIAVIAMAFAASASVHACSRCGAGHSGKTLKVPFGSTFAVTLESNPTTGYSWELSRVSPEGSVGFVDSSYSPVEPVLSGSGGSQTWILKALKKGGSEISLEYKRPWEKDMPPAKTRSYRITVY